MYIYVEAYVYMCDLYVRARKHGGGREKRTWKAARLDAARESIVKFSYKFLLDVNSKSAAGGGKGSYKAASPEG